jgi:hypothetical protein
MKRIGWKIGFGFWTILTVLVNYVCWGYILNSYLYGSSSFSEIELAIFLSLAGIAVLFLATEILIGFFAFRKEI